MIVEILLNSFAVLGTTPVVTMRMATVASVINPHRVLFRGNGLMSRENSNVLSAGC